MKLDYVAHRYNHRTNESRYVELRIDPELCSAEHIAAARAQCEIDIDQPSRINAEVAALLKYRDYLLDRAVARGHREECHGIIADFDRQIIALRRAPGDSPNG